MRPNGFKTWGIENKSKNQNFEKNLKNQNYGENLKNQNFGNVREKNAKILVKQNRGVKKIGRFFFLQTPAPGFQRRYVCRSRFFYVRP